MKQIIWKLKTEPVLRNSLLTALFSLLVAFGIDIDEEVKAAIITLIGAIAAFITRQEVTPTVKLEDNA